MGCLMDFSEAYKTMAWYDMETQEKLQSTLLVRRNFPEEWW